MPAFELRPRVIRQLAPLGVVYVLMLAANNLCLKYVEVTFYQVGCPRVHFECRAINAQSNPQIARSLTILFNIPLSYYLLNTSTSTPAILACLVVFLGFLIGSAGEVNFSWAGIGYGVASSAFVALYGIMVKKGLKVVDGDQW